MRKRIATQSIVFENPNYLFNKLEIEEQSRVLIPFAMFKTWVAASDTATLYSGNEASPPAIDSTIARVLETPIEKPTMLKPINKRIGEFGRCKREEGPVKKNPIIKVKLDTRINLRLSSWAGRIRQKEEPIKLVNRMRLKAPVIYKEEKEKSLESFRDKIGSKVTNIVSSKK